MSEWLNYVKAYAAKHGISYKQALRDASPSYKTRKEEKPEVIKQEPEKPKQEKTKRNNNKKVVENITLKL
jgi:hypothetical protein